MTPGTRQESSKQGIYNHSWGYLYRVICEAYPGLVPEDIRNMSMDDVLILVMDKKELRGSVFANATPQAIRDAGIKIPDNPTGKTLTTLVREQYDELEKIRELKKTIRHLQKLGRAEEDLDAMRREHADRLKKLRKNWIKSVV